MIRKTRINFVIVTMSLVAAIMIVFVASNAVINYHSSRNDAYAQLRKLLQQPQRTSPLPDDPSEMRKRTSVFECAFDENGNLATVNQISGGMGAFASQAEAETFVKDILQNGKIKNARKVDDCCYYGKSGNMYYAVTTDEQALSATVAVVDRHVEETLLAKMTLTLSLVSCVVLAVLFAIVWFLSYKVVKPAEQAFNKQKQFISDASHELKTPVTIIRANADAWQSDENHSPEWVGNILSQTERLTALVDEMLALARVEERKTVKENVDVSALVETAALEFEPVAYEQNKCFTCRAEQNVVLFAASDDIRRITTLLCDNAVKYCDSFAEVSLATIGKKVILRVVNDGCQVPAENKDKIFERFYRQDGSRTRATGGSGLGLATVKAVCDKNKWKIVVDCSEGGNMDISVLMQ